MAKRSKKKIKEKKSLEKLKNLELGEKLKKLNTLNLEKVIQKKILSQKTKKEIQL